MVLSQLPSKTGNHININAHYSIKLADGQKWQLVAFDGIKEWVEKFASIMELESCISDEYHKMIFARGESCEEGYRDQLRELGSDIKKGLPLSGWKSHSLGALKVWRHQDIPDVICEIGFEQSHQLDIVRMLLSVAPIYEHAQNSGGLPLHAALVEREGIGILLAGRGGTGKTTCCHRIPPPWRALCDDETLIVCTDKKQYFVHPFPTWGNYFREGSVRTWNVREHFPLSAIFFLEQANIDEAIPIRQGRAAAFINQAATHVCRRGWVNLNQEKRRVLRKKLFENACDLAKTVPVYKLRVNLKGRFWERIEDVLK